MSDEIKQVSHQLGILTACTANLEKQITLANQKLDCVHQQTIVTNESVKSAHKRLDSHGMNIETIYEQRKEDLAVVNKRHNTLKTIVDGHENLKWAGMGIFGLISLSLGLVGSYLKYFITGAPPT